VVALRFDRLLDWLCWRDLKSAMGLRQTVPRCGSRVILVDHSVSEQPAKEGGGRNCLLVGLFAGQRAGDLSLPGIVPLIRSGRMTLDGLAQRQLDDFDAHHPGTMFDESVPDLRTTSDAYRLQLRVATLRVARGERLAGYKVGCVSDVVRRQLAMNQPVFGHVFASQAYESGAVLSIGQFDHLAIEGEYAARIAVEIPDVVWLAEHCDRAVETFFPIIELHNNVQRGKGSPAIELIANNGLHAGFVAPCSESFLIPASAIASESISVSLNDEVAGTAGSMSFPGGPIESLLRLVEHMGRFGKRLEAGQIVLTGSPLPLYPVSAGDRIEVKTSAGHTVRALIRGSI
jgi:2-keto-4-pentenoate hydratase